MVERRLLRARPDALTRRYGRRLEAVLPRLRDADVLWQWPAGPLDPSGRAEPERAHDVQQGRFVFLNRERHFPGEVDWEPSGTSRLWRFHLHGFGYAVDLATAARQRRPGAYERLRSLVGQWLSAHRRIAGDPWHPFVASERLIAWAIARDLVRRELDHDADFAATLRQALLLHALYLDEHLETDVGGNHLLKNGVALLVAGALFDGPPAARWRSRAAALLERELSIQVLPDGGHYERSPMYHLLVLSDLLIALTAAGKRDLPLSVPLAEAVRRMQRVASTLVHQDGDIPLFNDAALYEAPLPARLIGPATLAAPDGLAAMGYFVLRSGDGVLIADCGAPSPDDLPAHAHADALSFELSIAGRRVLVNGGTYAYEAGSLRDHLRGTAAHNTVEVDGADQSEVWGIFRMGRRARVRLERWSPDAPGAVLVGSHNGYARMGVTHRRDIRAVSGSGWRVLDTLHGSGSHRAEARLRLHPDLRWRQDGASWLAVDADDSPLVRVQPFGPVAVLLEAGSYAERFGELRRVAVLCLRSEGPLPRAFGAWILPPAGKPIVV